MYFIRQHWYDVGGLLGIITLVFTFVFISKLSPYRLLMWLSWCSLLFHQFEEYRAPGTFPGMVNKVMFNSDFTDRYPLNTNTAFLVNVALGWTLYLLAALAGNSLVWLGMAAILVSLGNFIAHTFIFNLKGKTIYNAGLATSWLLFLPSVFFFFRIVSIENLATSADYLTGIPLGILINIVGVFKPVSWLADKNTSFRFKDRQLLPGGRKKSFYKI